MANSVDLDEAAHYEPPYQDLRCSLIPLCSSLALKVLITPRTEICMYWGGGKGTDGGEDALTLSVVEWLKLSIVLPVVKISKHKSL